jgi:hypothetical protein
METMQPDKQNKSQTDLNKNTRVQTLTEIALALLQQLGGEQDVGSGAVASDFILGGGGSGNEGSSWMLDLLQKRTTNNRTSQEDKTFKAHIAINIRLGDI